VALSDRPKALVRRYPERRPGFHAEGILFPDTMGNRVAARVPSMHATGASLSVPMGNGRLRVVRDPAGRAFLCALGVMHNAALSGADPAPIDLT